MTELINVTNLELQQECSIRNVGVLSRYFQKLFPDEFYYSNLHERMQSRAIAIEGTYPKQQDWLRDMELRGEQEFERFFRDIDKDDKAAVSMGILAIREVALEDSEQRTDEEFNLLWQSRFSRYGISGEMLSLVKNQTDAKILQFPLQITD